MNSILKTISLQKLSHILLQQVNFNSNNEIDYSEFKLKCYKLFPGKFNHNTITLTLYQLKQNGYNIIFKNKKNGDNRYRLMIKAKFKS